MSDDKTWFRAKTYGWGWGPATTWQGWFAYGLYVALMAWGWLHFLPEQRVGVLTAWTAGFTALLIAVCWIKGEKPAWRWGARR